MEPSMAAESIALLKTSVFTAVLWEKCMQKRLLKSLRWLNEQRHPSSVFGMAEDNVLMMGSMPLQEQENSSTDSYNAVAEFQS
jgi:hypothetical protein